MPWLLGLRLLPPALLLLRPLCRLRPREAPFLLAEAVRRDDASAAKTQASRCSETGLCPSLPDLLYVLSHCAQHGDKETILKLAALCSETRPEYLDRHSGFKHYLAEAVWIRGNVEESLRLFGEVYEQNPYMRRKVRLCLRHLVRDKMSEKGEAATVNVVAFGERLAVEHNDFFTLTYVWEACLLSEWHHDQTLSVDLLDRHPGLLDTVTSRVPYVVGLLLRQHRTESVYKLLETLLRHEMSTHYPFVVVALLDYQLNRGDLMSCVEIVRWCLDNDVPLPTLKQRDFIDLLSRYDLKTTGTEKRKPSPRFEF